MSLYELEKWKRYPIPAGFEMVIDTREQRPLFCNPPDDLIMVSRGLKHGDYSIVGYENEITIERKDHDFFNYVGVDRVHTIKKLEAMSEYLWAALVIEDDPFKIPPQCVKLTKKSIRDFFKSCRVHYGIHIFWGNRFEIELFVLEHLTYCYKHFGKLKKEAG